MMSLNEFLGHRPCECEICKARPAAVFMIARNESRACKAHVCLTCFEIAESSGFAAIIESVSLQEFMEVEDERLCDHG
jgi:hypothetical protein